MLRLSSQTGWSGDAISRLLNNAWNLRIDKFYHPITFPGGKDRERVQISGKECVVIARELPRDTARYRPKPFISGSIEN